MLAAMLMQGATTSETDDAAARNARATVIAAGIASVAGTVHVAAVKARVLRAARAAEHQVMPDE